MKILMVAAEMAPFAREGGLGDAVGALSKSLAARGHEVQAVVPLYGRIDRDAWGLRTARVGLQVPMGSLGRLKCTLLEGVLPGSNVPVLFVEHAPCFGRQGIYNDRGAGYPDNGERFALLSRASLESCRATGFLPRVIHVHDWHAAAVPIFLDTLYRGDRALSSAASVLTIHNMLHQGVFDRRLMDVLGVGWEQFTVRGLEFFGQVNLLKGGIYHATLLNTVSPSYALEIRLPEFAYGIEGVIRDRADDLWGILNGADYGEWNPETDPRIAANFSERDRSGKALCKGDLQRALGLPERPDVPLLGMVSRLVRQKGIDLVADAAQRLAREDVQLVLLGSGEPWVHEFFESFAGRHPGKAACRIGFDDRLAHRIIAGADFFLMPSRVEPCGLTQMYAMRYGTLPVVRATGGLRDTVDDFDEAASGGTGFTFHEATTGAFLDAIGRATRAFRSRPEAMDALIRNAMTKRFTWASAAARYESLYAAAIGRLEKRVGDGV